MTVFEYVMVLVSVILSLGIAKLLENHAELMKRGPSVRWSPTYLLWLVIIFFSHVDLWGSLWMIRDQHVWTLLSLLTVLSAAASLFYAAVLSVPDLEPGQDVDLWQFHLQNRRRYVTALMGYLILGAVLNMTIMIGHFDMATATGTLPGIALCLAAIFIPNRWVQIAAPILIAALMTIYFLNYFATLTG